MAKENPLNDFGLLIAYVIPGFIALWGINILDPALQPQIIGDGHSQSTIAGFLFSTVAAVAIGLTASTVRWMVIDTIHHATGVKPPKWDFSLLNERAAGFDIVVEHYYRYYQFYSNSLISLFFVLVARCWSLGMTESPPDLSVLGLSLLMGVFFAGSRDSLRRYYTRGGQLLSKAPRTVAG